MRSDSLIACATSHWGHQGCTRRPSSCRQDFPLYLTLQRIFRLYSRYSVLHLNHHVEERNLSLKFYLHQNISTWSKIHLLEISSPATTVNSHFSSKAWPSDDYQTPENPQKPQTFFFAKLISKAIKPYPAGRSCALAAPSSRTFAGPNNHRRSL